MLLCSLSKLDIIVTVLQSIYMQKNYLYYGFGGWTGFCTNIAVFFRYLWD